MDIKQLGSAKTALIFVSLIMSVLCVLSANGIYTYLFSESPSKSEGLIVSAIVAISSLVLLCLHLWIAISHRKDLSLRTLALTSIPLLTVVMLTIYAHVLGIPW